MKAERRLQAVPKVCDDSEKEGHEQDELRSLQFRKKQMRDRAFAERSAERRALAAAKALATTLDETSFAERPCEHLVEYKTCTEAFNITVEDSAVDVVTNMARKDQKKDKDGKL